METLIKDLSVSDFKELINDAVRQAMREFKISDDQEEQLDIEEYLKAKSFKSELIPFDIAFREIEKAVL